MSISCVGILLLLAVELGLVVRRNGRRLLAVTIDTRELGKRFSDRVEASIVERSEIMIGVESSWIMLRRSMRMTRSAMSVVGGSVSRVETVVSRSYHVGMRLVNAGILRGKRVNVGNVVGGEFHLHNTELRLRLINPLDAGSKVKLSVRFYEVVKTKSGSNLSVRQIVCSNLLLVLMY